MKIRLTMAAFVAAVSCLCVAAATAIPAAAAAAPPTATGVTATLTNATGDVTGAVQGTLSNLNFTLNQAGDLVLSGTFTDTLGNITNFTTTVLQATGSCQILDLTLGPLDLNLLGLMVHLDTVHLNITAQRGPGNLLGNLLCAVAGLLDANGGANDLTMLLNRLVGGL
jgi:hypothetical protein